MKKINSFCFFISWINLIVFDCNLPTQHVLNECSHIIINKIALIVLDNVANKLYDGRRTAFRSHE